MFQDKATPRDPTLDPDALWVMSTRLPPGPYEIMELLGYQGRNFKAISAITNCKLRITELGNVLTPIVGFYDYEHENDPVDLETALQLLFELAAEVHPVSGKGTVLPYDRTIHLSTCTRRNHPKNPFHQYEQETNTSIYCNWEENTISIRPRTGALREWMRLRGGKDVNKISTTDYGIPPDCEKAQKLVQSYICEFIPMLVPIDFPLSSNELKNKRDGVLSDIARKTNTYISVADVNPPIVLIHPMLGREKSDLEQARRLYLQRVKVMTDRRGPIF